MGHSSQITRRACVRAMLFLDLSTFSLGTNEYSVRAQARLYQVQFDCQYISSRQFTARTELSGKGLCSGAHPWKIKRKTERISWKEITIFGIITGKNFRAHDVFTHGLIYSNFVGTLPLTHLRCKTKQTVHWPLWVKAMFTRHAGMGWNLNLAT